MSLAQDMLAMLNGLPADQQETVTYTPSGGSPRAITASVLRSEPLSEFAGGGTVPAVRYQVSVARDSVLGVDDPTIGADTMSLKEHVSDAAASVFRVSRILFEDEGAYTLEVVK